MPEKPNNQRFYVSTVADDAEAVAAQYGLGLELAEFCTASNMDDDFDHWDMKVREKIKRTQRLVLHAPFNELCPAAIDPLALDLAYKRYHQAYLLAKSYGIKRMVAHSGYMPFVYFKEYFIERSVEFWKNILSDKPEDFTVVLENVLEDEPFMLVEIIKGVEDERLKLCLDIGHANITKKNLTVLEWVEAVLPYLGHVHLHNNFDWPDSHNALDIGDMDLQLLLARIIKGAPKATVTLEIRESCRSSAEWLNSFGFIKS